MTYDYRDDPILGPALAYWIDKRGGRLLPRKRDIDPTEIPRKVLPHLQLIDVIDGGARFRFRLVGTAVVNAYGKDYTGRYADELFPDDRLNFIQGIYRTVCDSKTPILARNKYHTPKKIELFATRIYMPVSDDHLNVRYILGVLRFEFAASFDSGVWGEEARMDPGWHYTESIQVDNP